MTLQSTHLIETTAPEVQALVLQLFIDRWKPYRAISDTLLQNEPVPTVAPNPIWVRMLERSRFREQFIRCAKEMNHNLKHNYCCAVGEVLCYLGRMRYMAKHNRYDDNVLASYELVTEEVLLLSYRKKVDTVPHAQKLRSQVGWLEHCEGVLASIAY